MRILYEPVHVAQYPIRVLRQPMRVLRSPIRGALLGPAAYFQGVSMAFPVASMPLRTRWIHFDTDSEDTVRRAVTFLSANDPRRAASNVLQRGHCSVSREHDYCGPIYPIAPEVSGDSQNRCTEPDAVTQPEGAL